MLDKETADLIAAAIYTNDITTWTVDQLDELAEFAYANDPNVSFSDLDYVPDAGAELHGTNTEEEKMNA